MQDDATFVTLYPCDESDNEETREWVAVWVGLTRSHAGGRVEGWDGMQYVPAGTYRLESTRGFADPRENCFPYAVEAAWRRVGPADETQGFASRPTGWSGRGT